MDWKAFSNFDELSSSLADRVQEQLATAIAARAQASLVVPGGTTPGAFFDLLCRRELQWEKITVTLTDERWVPVSSDRSNERLVRTRLLVHRAADARFVALKSPAATAHDAEPEIESRIVAIDRPFDVIIAGMGDDGHTFSWIPRAEGLAGALDNKGRLVHAIVPPASSNLGERITLTLRAALESKAIFVLARGESKKRAYETALAGTDPADLPIRALMRQSQVPVAFYWSED